MLASDRLVQADASNATAAVISNDFIELRYDRLIPEVSGMARSRACS